MILFDTAEVVETTVAAAEPEVASIGDALSYSLFTIAIVFGVLLLIFVCIKIFSAILSSFAPKEAPAAVAAAPAATPVAEEEFSSGSLRLKGCDEKTAAMIMAIVSDNTGIPLSELVFKSITLVDEKN